jgi:hypothetical protein
VERMWMPGDARERMRMELGLSTFLVRMFTVHSDLQDKKILNSRRYDYTGNRDPEA